jgi:hypothetical protein
MSNREQTRDIKDFFGGNVEASWGCNNTTATLVVGPIDLLQIQFDTVSTEAEETSLEIAIDGSTVKRRAISGAGTAEFTFLGHRKRVDSQVVLTRPDGDTHGIFYTVIYRPID